MERRIEEVISEQSAMQPSIQAASARDGNSIYSPLKKYSTQLVECLITIGIQSRTIVPVYCDKARWVPVAILGVLKAGM